MEDKFVKLAIFGNELKFYLENLQKGYLQKKSSNHKEIQKSNVASEKFLPQFELLHLLLMGY